MASRFSATSLFVLAALSLGACNSSDVTAPTPQAEGSFTVDASQNFVYVSFADSSVITLTEPATQSSAWDIALFSTNVTLNGGQAGPGGVTGFCICQNTEEDPTNSDWLAMTPDSEKADFEALASQLESKLSELIRFGEQNDAITDKLHRMTLALIGARDVADAIWSGLGIVGITLIGWLVFRQRYRRSRERRRVVLRALVRQQRYCQGAGYFVAEPNCKPRWQRYCRIRDCTKQRCVR